jgi:hypothetical protein
MIYNIVKLMSLRNKEYKIFLQAYYLDLKAKLSIDPTWIHYTI